MTNKRFAWTERRHREYDWHFNLFPSARPQAPSLDCVQRTVIKLRKAARLDHADVSNRSGLQIKVQAEYCNAFMVKGPFIVRIIWFGQEQCIGFPWRARLVPGVPDVANTSCIYGAAKLIMNLLSSCSGYN